MTEKTEGEIYPRANSSGNFEKVEKMGFQINLRERKTFEARLSPVELLPSIKRK